MVGGAASPALHKSSCLTLELCYPLWKKQGLESGAWNSLPSSATDARMILRPSVCPAYMFAVCKHFDSVVLISENF